MAKGVARSNWKYRRVAFIALAAAAFGVLALMLWANSPQGEVLPEALLALKSDERVKVTRERWLVFEPRDLSPSTGFIFYPGARVTVEAYAPLGRALAEAGHLAILAPMPFNLAILDAEAATAIIDAYPGIVDWVIGGHSLGGVMAARYAANHQDRVRGLVLMAAYPEDGVDLSATELAVVSIYAELDGLATIEEIESTFPRLPADSEKVMIVGGNHAQFGWYGRQSGDNPAALSREAQYEMLIAATLAVMRETGK